MVHSVHNNVVEESPSAQMVPTVQGAGLGTKLVRDPYRSGIDADSYPVLAKYSDRLRPPVREIIGREHEKEQILASLLRPEVSNVLLLAPPGSGKLLPLNTQIPTPTGWTTMGELAVGDQVLGQDGRPTVVTYLSEIEQTPELYDLTFSDGSVIRACADHQWLVSSAEQRDQGTGQEQVLTTAQMIEFGVHVSDDVWSPNFAVRPAAPLTLDTPRVEERERGEWVTQACGEGRQWALWVQEGAEVSRRMPDLQPYLRAPEEVRRGFLDGALSGLPIGPGVTVPTEVAAEEFAELLRGLGVPTWQKGAAVIPLWDEGLLQITAISPAPTEPGRCIQVDNAEHMYLCGRGMIPTHNTVLVQATMLADHKRTYLEIDLARMIADLSNPDEMAARIKALFDDAVIFSADEDSELVLFIDEFHQIVQLSAAAVEALKPILAASGTLGILVIAATTFDEYHRYIAPNQPLDERLQKINLTPADGETTIEILRDMAAKYEVLDQFPDNHLFEQIYELTNRYIPRSVQPRKSILTLDAMIGWHRLTGRRMSMSLLTDVFKESEGVNIAFSVDGASIKRALDQRVFSQDLATRVVSRRLQLCVADLHDKSKPMSSFLFAGSTGVGKACADGTPVPVWSADSTVSWKRHGDLQVGDRVFDREGNPTTVTGVYPQGVRDLYRVTLWDERTIDVDGEHRWSVYTSNMGINAHTGREVEPKVMTTLEMVGAGVAREYEGDDRRHLKFFLPANGAVQWPERDLNVDPYVVGALIADGRLTEGARRCTCGDEEVVERVAARLGVTHKPLGEGAVSCSYVFPNSRVSGSRDKLLQTAEVLVGMLSGERRIPEAYRHASVEQRWELVRGLFDTDGTIESGTGRYGVSYSTTSEALAEDVRSLLFSLGVSNSVNRYERERNGDILVECVVHAKVTQEETAKFFHLERKQALAREAVEATADRERAKKFDMVGISRIEKLPEPGSATCIMVDNEEHLYQAGPFVVTHNTEMAKQLARVLFGDDTGRLIRFDMSEYALDESLEQFRSEMTRQVGNQGHAILLFDEIEKASRVNVRLLLQVLDDGRLSDDNGRQVSFLNTYIILTTNAGSEIFKTIGAYAADDAGSGEGMVDFLKNIEKSIRTTQGFPPELLGRIDAIVPFQPLSLETHRKIIENQLLKLRNEVMGKHGITLRVDPRVLQYVTDDKVDSDTDAGGARGAVRMLQTDVTTEVAAFVNTHPDHKVIRVGIEGEMRSDNKHLRKTQAKVVVTPSRV